MLRRKEMQGAIDVRAKLDAIFGHLAQMIQAEDLKAAGIRQDGVRPAHKLMQPAQAANALMPRAQIQMIGIAQQNLRVDFF